MGLEMKICRECLVEKPKEEFIKNKNLKDGIDTLCLPCNRDRVKQWKLKNPELRKIQRIKESTSDKIYNQRKHLKHTYGISVEDYNTMFEDQRGCCAICGAHQKEFKRRLAVDHNHTTGEVRKLLCNNCNSVLGYAKENIKILTEAINYLTGY